LTLVFLTVLGFVVANFNLMYHQNNVIPIQDNSTQQLFVDYQDTAQTQIKGGDVDFSAQQGITLKSSYGLTKDIINVVWTFISGGFIENTFAMMNLGESGMALAKGLRVIYFLSLVFALFYLLFKVSP
jgi:hypothetical protein